MNQWTEAGMPPSGSTRDERNWLQQHKDHPIYFVKEWRAVIALGNGPGELWACDCKGDGDRQWFHAVDP